MNESDFNKAVCKKLISKLSYPTSKIWKIRDDYQTGVPDNFLMDAGNTMWVEVKYLKTYPKRDNTLIRINLSELQKQWLLNLSQNNQRARVLVGIGQGPTVAAVLLTPQEAIAGITTAQFLIRQTQGYNQIAQLLKDELHG